MTIFQCSLRADPDWKPPVRQDVGDEVDFQCSLRADPDWKIAPVSPSKAYTAFSALCEPILIGSAEASGILVKLVNFQCSLRADPDWKLSGRTRRTWTHALSVLSASRS
mgnify:CR=1 FL=1